jgi:hypothetical protein
VLTKQILCHPAVRIASVLLLTMKKTKLNSHQIEFFRTKTEKAFEEHPYLKKLYKHLLHIGGEAVVLWNGTNGEKMTQELLGAGQAESGCGAILKLGDPSECHENSARFYHENPRRYEVRTGYALSDDGIWRPHSWVVDAEEHKIIETTQKRVTYFGVIKLKRIC